MVAQAAQIAQSGRVACLATSREPTEPAQGRALAWIERVGNRLPDPAMLFVIGLLVVALASALGAGHGFLVPSKEGPQARAIVNLLSPRELVILLTSSVKTFTGFPPLGVVLVALLGVGVADHAGFIDAAMKRLIEITPRRALTPTLLLVALLSHTTGDAGIVLVIPLGGAVFYAAGRHPLGGIACAFAGVSGGFSANPLPSGLDPLLQGITQAAVALTDKSRSVNPLCNWTFTATSSLVIIGAGWWITERVVEPRLSRVPVDGAPSELPSTEPLGVEERRGLSAGLASVIGVLALLAAAVWPPTSPLRGTGGALTAFDAPLMQAIIPIVFLLFLVPGTVHGYVSGRFSSHRDVVQGMTRAMSSMGYYLVMAFFASLFVWAFNESQLGAFIAVRGAEGLRALGLHEALTVIGLILFVATINLLIGSASAKWALLAPVLVPMSMQLGLAPEYVQAAFRIGDSSTNIVSPLLPYFPLIVAFAQRYVRSAGVGTLTSLMIPYSLAFLCAWTPWLLAFRALGVPLGVQAAYTYP